MLIKNCPSHFQRHFFYINTFLEIRVQSDMYFFLFIFSFSVSYIYNHIHTVHSSISIRRGLSPFIHYLLLIGKNGQKPLLGRLAEIRTQACHRVGQRIALPIELNCTLLRYTVHNTRWYGINIIFG